jgi:hypothetical protein
MHRVLELRANAWPLAVARIIIGINAALASFEAWRALSRLLRPTVVRIPFFPWIPLLPASALPAFIALWLVAALLLVVGWKTRVAGCVLTLVTWYALLLDQQVYSNHLYLLALLILLLTISDSGAAWSLDARQRAAPSDVAAWPIVLLKLQVTLVYFFSAIAKITPLYLSGEVMALMLKNEGWLALPQPWRTPAVMSCLAMASIAAELFIAIGLWSPRLRRFAIVTGIGFHLSILAIMNSSRLSLLIFALSMFAAYVLFVDEDPRQWRWSRFVSNRNGRAT